MRATENKTFDFAATVCTCWLWQCKYCGDWVYSGEISAGYSNRCQHCGANGRCAKIVDAMGRETTLVTEGTDAKEGP